MTVYLAVFLNILTGALICVPFMVNLRKWRNYYRSRCTKLETALYIAQDYISDNPHGFDCDVMDDINGALWGGE